MTLENNQNIPTHTFRHLWLENPQFRPLSQHPYPWSEFIVWLLCPCGHLSNTLMCFNISPTSFGGEVERDEAERNWRRWWDAKGGGSEKQKPTPIERFRYMVVNRNPRYAALACSDWTWQPGIMLPQCVRFGVTCNTRALASVAPFQLSIAHNFAQSMTAAGIKVEQQYSPCSVLVPVMQTGKAEYRRNFPHLERRSNFAAAHIRCSDFALVMWEFNLPNADFFLPTLAHLLFVVSCYYISQELLRGGFNAISVV